MAALIADGSGRIRLAWRLAVWALALVAGLAVLGPVLPPGISGMAGPLLGAGLLAGWAALALDGRPPAALGFRLAAGVPGEIGLGLGLGVGVALLPVALVALAGGVSWSAEEGSAGAWLWGAAAALGAFALPAAAEEVVFRGYPFQALAERAGSGAALIVTSAGFAAVHLANPGATWTGAANVAAAGVFLGVVLLRTGSLWWATAVHLGWNWAHGFLVDLPVSGHDLVDAPGVVARTAGPEWLSGGAFGPEGSVAATLVLGAAAAWAWRTDRLGPAPSVREARPLALLEPRGHGEAGSQDPPRGGGR